MAIAWAMVIIQWEYMVLNHPRILDMGIFFLVSDSKIVKKKKKKKKKRRRRRRRKEKEKKKHRKLLTGDIWVAIPLLVYISS